jgi:hypothetical protein
MSLDGRNGGTCQLRRSGSKPGERFVADLFERDRWPCDVLGETLLGGQGEGTNAIIYAETGLWRSPTQYIQMDQRTRTELATAKEHYGCQLDLMTS